MFSENFNAKAVGTFEKVCEQVDTYAKKGKDSFEEVKEKAANLHLNIHEVVERAKNTADPYVKSTRQIAEHIVESGKESTNSVTSTIHKCVNHASRMYSTKNGTFCVVSELIAIYVFVWWYIITLIPFVRHFIAQSYNTADSLKIVSGVEKLASLTLEAVDRIPVVGPRLHVIITSFQSEISQDVKLLIGQISVKNKHE
ncbi:unnamed protein product [Phytomonas sp. Hart1]|nr:unnamed protein product [Phytomonas sp. Hart1]|eukprot:CCW66276.1 unnamed protein product [Phytomonas sp. isolate Hart1]